jgi:hypothetical protein
MNHGGFNGSDGLAHPFYRKVVLGLGIPAPGARHSTSSKKLRIRRINVKKYFRRVFFLSGLIVDRSNPEKIILSWGWGSRNFEDKEMHLLKILGKPLSKS